MTRFARRGKLWLLALVTVVAFALSIAIVPALGPGSTAHAQIYPCSGDVNGDGSITITDALLIAQGEVGLIAERDCDVNGDGKTSITDALLIAQDVVGILP